ncbi:MAG: hypothetical protein WCF22_18570 [Candidatus Sulfotelmatobacter sp.]
MVAEPAAFAWTDGGGGTISGLSRLRFDVDLAVADVFPDTLTDGGGGTMVALGPRGEVRENPEAPEAEGAGGTILGARVRPELRLDDATLGGGGTMFAASSREDV